ncbi:flavin reductase family protein [Neisseria sp. Ec49-e6-T10]|uniref:flavin reductase family protein n=1 Tax=Neisseria sp. Ec49-e6-T10 TaxID=3140744 RepID=UPI003EBFE5C7
MRHYQAVPLEKSYLLLNHGPTVLITSADKGKQNVMSAAWAMPIDFFPPKIAVVIDKSAYSRELIEQSGQFALHVPSKKLANQTLSAGSHCGKNIDKFSLLNLSIQPAQTIQAPIINDCLAVLECQVIFEHENQQKHDLFIAHVTAAWANSNVFDQNRWHIQRDTDKSIHYQAGGTFFAIGESFQAEDILPKD